jgi:hypothetical protein
MTIEVCRLQVQENDVWTQMLLNCILSLCVIQM